MPQPDDNFLDTVLGEEKKPPVTKSAPKPPDAVLSELRKQTALLSQIVAANDTAARKLRSIELATAIVAVAALVGLLFGFKLVIF